MSLWVGLKRNKGWVCLIVYLIVAMGVCMCVSVQYVCMKRCQKCDMRPCILTLSCFFPAGAAAAVVPPAGHRHGNTCFRWTERWPWPRLNPGNTAARITGAPWPRAFVSLASRDKAVGRFTCSSADGEIKIGGAQQSLIHIREPVSLHETKAAGGSEQCFSWLNRWLFVQTHISKSVRFPFAKMGMRLFD